MSDDLQPHAVGISCYSTYCHAVLLALADPCSLSVRQIELADPDLIVCLGSPSTQAITGTKDGILKARGRFYPYRVGSREIRALATLHPAYLLRQPLQKRLAWRDFRTLRAALDGKA